MIQIRKNFLLILGLLCSGVLGEVAPAYAALDIPFTVTMSEAVTVDTTGGTPSIAVTDVGGTTVSPARAAVYTSGSGTAALTFTYTTQAGDFDVDSGGITIGSTIALNGGTIRDAVGNDLAVLTFTAPNTSAIKVDYPSIAMDFIADEDGQFSIGSTAYSSLSSFTSPSGWTFARASVATYVDSSGVIQTVTGNTPRLDHSTSSPFSRLGLLMEEARTNSLLYSSDFTQSSYWAKQNSTGAYATVSAPDGATSAFKLDESTPNAAHRLVRSGNAMNGIYAVSVFVKAAERRYAGLTMTGTGSRTANIFVDLNTGTLLSEVFTNVTKISSGVISYPNGWYRIYMSFNTNGASTLAFAVPIDNDGTLGATSGDTYVGTAGSGIYIWGAQLELGSNPTSYIPTGASTVTRNAEYASVSVGSWLGTNQGTIFAQARWPFSTSSATNYDEVPFGLNNATFNNDIQYRRSAGNFLFKDTTGPNSATLSYTASLPVSKMAAAYASTGTAATIGGGSVVTGTGVVPVSPTYFWVGGTNDGSGQYPMNGHIQKLKYYPLKIPNAQLQLMTQ